MKGLTILCLLGLLVAPSRSSGQECSGLTVASVQFAGCETGRCASPALHGKLASLTDLMRKTWTEEGQTLATQRLRSVGLFQSVSARCTRISPRTAAITFRVEPNRYVRKVRIEGTETLFRSDLEKRMFLRMGAILNPDTKESTERLQRQASALETYVRQQGFEAAEVAFRWVLVPPDLVDVVFLVDEGTIGRFDRIRVSIEQPDSSKGNPEYRCPRLIERELMPVLKINRGDLYTSSTSREVRRRVRQYLQQYGFRSPRVKVVFQTDSRTLEVQVRVASCFSIQIFTRPDDEPNGAGFERSRDPALYEALPFRESGAFDHREAQRGVEELLLYWRLRGYLFATVEMQFVDYREWLAPWSHPLYGGVIYRVTTGEPSEIREIRFEGVQKLKPSDLLDLMETRRYDFFDVGGFLLVEQLFGDLTVLKSHYRERGFFRMSYPGATASERVQVTSRRGNDRTFWRFSFQDRVFDIEKPDWENPIRLIIRIHEGEPSRVRTLRVIGAGPEAPQELLQDLALTEAGPFSPSILRGTLAELRTRYRQAGFSPTITASCVGFDPDVPQEECNPDTVSSSEVDLTIHVQEGIRQTMGEVFVVGNLKTRQGTLTRDFPPAGELYDQGRIDEAVRRLRNLGVFSSVRTHTIGQEEDPPRSEVAAVVQVEETTTKFLEISAGFQTIARPEERVLMHPLAREGLATSLQVTGSLLSGSAGNQVVHFPDVLLMGEVSYHDKSFLGFAKNLVLPVKYGLSTTDPARFASFTPTWFDRRFLLHDLTMRITPLIIYDRALKLLDTFEYGAENELSYALRQGIYVSLITRVTQIAWKLPSAEDFGDMEFQFKSTPQIRFDWRDNPINPTSGSLVYGRLSYINALNQRADRDHFWKFEVGTQLYLSLRQVVITALHLRVGDSLTTDQSSLPENERFRLGGSNGMRGFAYGGISQYQRDSSLRLTPEVRDGVSGWTTVGGGDSVVHGTLEARFPLLRRAGVWGAVFADFGGLADDLSLLHVNSIRFSVGLGIRWLIGGQIPIRLDYGFVLDRRCTDVDFSTGQCVRTEDPGALDFGILYTF